MIKRIQFIIFGIVILLGAGWLFSQTVYAATTLTVTGYGDFSDLNPGDGVCDTSLPLPGEQCSLRAAIEELNAQGPDTVPHRIEFNITGSGPFIITPGTELPYINVPVEIDATTQPGASCPTQSAPANLLIVLDGSSAGTNARGLVLNSGSEGSLIQGLVIGNFDGSAVLLWYDDNAVRCNHIGVGADGVTAMPNGNYAISISGDNNVIGGQAAHARRNVISGNNGGGFNVSGINNIIRNNFIGTTADGLNPLGNGSGIFVASNASNNSIGGTAPIARNVIGDQNGTGIDLRGDNNIVLGNLIGVGRDGHTPLPNNIGISVESSGNIIGGIAPGEPNVIAYNDYDGIRVEGSSPPVENAIRGNSIFENNDLGIDLDGDGVDTNDIGDFDTGPNGFQNYPVLHGISTSNILSGTLDSTANTLYFIEIYRNDSCDPSGYGEGQELVRWANYLTGMNGRVNFDLDTTFWSISPGDYLTALATDPNGNTSEFSACILVPSPPVTPTPSPTATNMPTNTPSPTATPTATTTPSPSPTSTPPAPPIFTEQAYIPVVLK